MFYSRELSGVIKENDYIMFDVCVELWFKRCDGMSPRVTFPIMAASAAFTLVAASVKFIKEGAYNRKASFAILVAGIVGVFIAAYIVKSLPLAMLTWLVIVVVVYTAIALLLRAGSK